MTLQLPFFRAYLENRECELYRDENGITAYVPTKASCECRILLGTDSYVTAEIVARAMGLEPNWN